MHLDAREASAQPEACGAPEARRVEERPVAPQGVQGQHRVAEDDRRVAGRRHRHRLGELGAERGWAAERARPVLLLQELLEARLVQLDEDHVGPGAPDELRHFTQLLAAGRVHGPDDAERACRARDAADARKRLDAPARRRRAAEQHSEAQTSE